jgi:hypothetical protein
MDLSGKDFVKFTIAFGIIVFVIMWFLGGACTSLFVAPQEVSSVCISQGLLSGLRNVPIIGLFVPYNEWVSLMYWFAPIAGFVFAFFAIKWWNSYFETKEASCAWFVLIVLLILLGGYYVNLSWYYGEAATLNSRNGVKVGLYFCFDNDSGICNETTNKLNQEYIAQAQRNQSSNVTQLIMVNFWAELRESILLTFLFGAIAGWFPLFIKNRFEKSGKK